MFQQWYGSKNAGEHFLSHITVETCFSSTKTCHGPSHHDPTLTSTPCCLASSLLESRVLDLVHPTAPVAPAQAAREPHQPGEGISRHTLLLAYSSFKKNYEEECAKVAREPHQPEEGISRHTLLLAYSFKKNYEEECAKVAREPHQPEEGISGHSSPGLLLLPKKLQRRLCQSGQSGSLRGWRGQNGQSCAKEATLATLHHLVSQ